MGRDGEGSRTAQGRGGAMMNTASLTASAQTIKKLGQHHAVKMKMAAKALVALQITS
jgi:hypothetical protein